LISFPPGTEIFQFPGFASTPYVFRCRYLQRRWVSPFGHRGINARCQLHRAFRRLPRPSSPLTAKASTVCACSLDHITPSCLRALIKTRHSPNCLNDTSSTRQSYRSLPGRETLAQPDAPPDFREPRRLLRPKFSKNTARPQRRTASNSLVCAGSRMPLSTQLVGLGGLEPPASPLSGVRSNHLSYRPG
jgi:hypothetical protein